MALHRGNRFPQSAVGFNQAIVNLLVEPPFELVHDRTAIFLVVSQAGLRTQLLVARLCVMVKHLSERLDDYLALPGKHVFQVAELTTPMGQTMTANECRLVRLIMRERI